MTAKRRSAAVGRRRLAVAALALAAAAAGAAVGAGGDAEPPPSIQAEQGVEKSPGAPEQADAPPAPPPCPEEIATEPARLAGQALIVRMEATATDELIRRAGRGELGGVILFPPEGTDHTALADQIARLDRAARGAGFPEPLVAIDQEGGEVKRLIDAPPSVAPAEIGSAGGEELAFAQGEATGRTLKRIGVDIDLAPVLDVPAAGSFIASRAFSDEPAEVGRLGSAFAAGLAQAGVAATAKHFPGLGLAVANTDFEASAVDATRAELEPGFEPFETAIAAGIPLVMVANAVYPALDPALPASLSRRVIDGELRDEIGFDGIVITDDLGAAAIGTAGYDEPAAVLAALDAGADIALFALTDGTGARAALERAAKRDAGVRRRLVESCACTTALRARLEAGTPTLTSSASP